MESMFQGFLCYLRSTPIFQPSSRIVLPWHAPNSACNVSYDHATPAAQSHEKLWIGKDRFSEGKRGTCFGRYSSNRRRMGDSTSGYVGVDVSLVAAAFILSEGASLSSLGLSSSSNEQTISAGPPTNTTPTSTSSTDEVISETIAITAGSISQSSFTILETLTSISHASDPTFSTPPLTPYATSSNDTSMSLSSSVPETYTSNSVYISTASTSWTASVSSTTVVEPTSTISNSSNTRSTVSSTSVGGSPTSTISASEMSSDSSTRSASSTISSPTSSTPSSTSETSILSASSTVFSSSISPLPGTTVIPTSSVVASSSSNFSSSGSSSSRVETSSWVLSTSSSELSSSTSVPSSSSAFSRPQTTVFTTVVTTRVIGGHTTTVGIAGTGVLGTDTPRVSGFARNTGAIVGVAVSATFVLLTLLLLIFFTCKRYKSRRSDHGSLENILAVARETSWRAPLDGDESDSDSEYRGRGRSTAAQPHIGVTNQENGSMGYLGDHLSSEAGGHGSSESANIGTAPMLPSFGGQPYLPGTASNGTPEMTQVRRDGETSHAPDIVQTSSGGSKSAVSLTVVGGSSSHDHGTGWSSSSSGHQNTRVSQPTRNSFSGPRPMPRQDTDRRHKSTPPSAFPTSPGLSFDLERQQEQSDKSSIKSLFDRLRGGRKISNKSISLTLRSRSNSKSQPQMSEGTTTSAVPDVPLFSPSLLNPPVPVPSSAQTLLRFPRGVTGRGYPEFPSPPPLRHGTSTTSTINWPPLTLPPSPDPTENSSMVEGLLHPRLGKRLNGPEHDSTSSLRDHEDYSRPISGLISNHIRSTTTFDTTLGSEDGAHIGVAS
ncbi:hypothetical protein CPC08DRAFT_363778 [Agrocybe pediades]|nr:hypothetical protein CPC08DRAFT_363778 [Agrocybe pediades]